MLTGTLLANLGEFATGPRVRINPLLKHILGGKIPTSTLPLRIRQMMPCCHWRSHPPKALGGFASMMDEQDRRLLRCPV